MTTECSAIQFSRLWFEALDQFSPDNLFILRVEDGRFELDWANRAMVRASGAPLAAMRGKSAQDVLGPEAGYAVEENYRRCVQTLAPVHYEEDAVDADGNRQHWHTLIVPLVSDGVVTHLMGVSRNVSALKSAQQQASAANAAKAAFVGNLGHELRSQLNGVIGGLSLLEDSALAPAQREAVAIVRDAASVMGRFADDVADYARLEAGRLSVQSQAMDLRAVIDGLCRSLMPQALSKRIQLHCDIADSVPLYPLLGDADRLRQVLGNILGNAIKFTGELGYVSLRVKASRRQYTDTVDVSFSIRDNGVGMAPEDISKLFRPFTRLPRTSHVNGTGLGLAIADELVRRMGGTITVLSELGGGSQFEVVVPFIITEDEGDIASGKPILIVENDRNSALFAKEALQFAGWQVTVVVDGLAAVQLCQQQEFSAIVMDITLPFMDGIQATQLLREGGVATPIIAYTGDVLLETGQRCLDAGMNEILHKPVSPDRLIERVTFWSRKLQETG